MIGKKNVLTALTALAFIFCMTASYADVSVSSYNGNYKPRGGYYDAEIKSVQIGYSEQLDASGKIIKRKHDYVYVDTTGEGNFSFTFSKDDLQNGLALMGAIGKKMSVTLDLDETNRFIVKNIVVK